MASMLSSGIESIAVALLTKYLGKYVCGLQKENLKLSIGSGNVVLENLELRKEAIDELELPVNIKHGYLGKLSLSLSWKNFASQPAIISIDRLFLIVGPKPSSEYKEAAERIELINKKRKLKLAELFSKQQQQQQDQGPDAAKNSSSMGSMAKGWLTKIMDNVQIYIDKIHIRYEDDQTYPGHPFVAGITLEHLHAQSTNDSWEPAFVNSEEKLVHKVLFSSLRSHDKQRRCCHRFTT